jgi:hypothetical protein
MVLITTKGAGKAVFHLTFSGVSEATNTRKFLNSQYVELFTEGI